MLAVRMTYLLLDMKLSYFYKYVDLNYFFFVGFDYSLFFSFRMFSRLLIMNTLTLLTFSFTVVSANRFACIICSLRLWERVKENSNDIKVYTCWYTTYLKLTEYVFSLMQIASRMLLKYFMKSLRWHEGRYEYIDLGCDMRRTIKDQQ